MTTYPHTLAGRAAGNVPADEFAAFYGTGDAQRQIVLTGGGNPELRFPCAAGEFGVVSNTFAAATGLWSMAAILTLISTPGASCQLATPRTAAGKSASFLLNTSRVPSLRNAADASIGTGTAIPLAKRVLWQMAAQVGTGSADGKAMCKVTSLDGATTYLNTSSATTDIGTAQLTNDRIGKLDAAGAFDFRLDNLITNDGVYALIDPAVDAQGVNVYPAEVTLGTWTGDPLSLGDGSAASYLESVASPTSANPLILTMPPLPLGELSFYPASLYQSSALNQTVQVYKADGTTKLYERTYALTPANAEEPITLDATALAAIPALSDRYALQVRIFDAAP